VVEVSEERKAKREGMPQWVRDLLIILLVGLSGWTLHTVQQLTLDVAVLATRLEGEQGLRGELKERVARLEQRLMDAEKKRGEVR